MTDDLDRFVSIPEAAARLCMSKAKAYALIAADEFPVPVFTIGGRAKVSLRRLAEFINGEAA
jgi:predicted DNA-binding transcriptional regulator AlpA